MAVAAPFESALEVHSEATKPPLTGRERSLANLRPAKKGDIRNPTGITHKRNQPTIVDTFRDAVFSGDAQAASNALLSMMGLSVRDILAGKHVKVAIRVVDLTGGCADISTPDMEGALDAGRNGFFITME